MRPLARWGSLDRNAGESHPSVPWVAPVPQATPQHYN